MIITKPFPADPKTGLKRLWHYDTETEAETIETIQDVEPILDLNRAEHNQFDSVRGWKGDMHKVASIPLPIFYELQRQGIGDDEDRDAGFPRLKKWLMNPDYSGFRTRPGAI